jgi:hypothetical protein
VQFWRERGDDRRADLLERSAEIERTHAQLERDWAAFEAGSESFA